LHTPGVCVSPPAGHVGPCPTEFMPAALSSNCLCSCMHSCKCLRPCLDELKPFELSNMLWAFALHPHLQVCSALPQADAAQRLPAPPHICTIPCTRCVHLAAHSTARLPEQWNFAKKGITHILRNNNRRSRLPSAANFLRCFEVSNTLISRKSKST